MNGIDVAKAVLEEGHHTRFILLTLFKDKAFLNLALELGGKGFLLKESTEKEILECIRLSAKARRT